MFGIEGDKGDEGDYQATGKKREPCGSLSTINDINKNARRRTLSSALRVGNDGEVDFVSLTLPGGIIREWWRVSRKMSDREFGRLKSPQQTTQNLPSQVACH
jgi:hypothetical protein